MEKPVIENNTKNTPSTAEGQSDSTGLVMLPMPEGMARPETGPMQFGDDWPGMFIRGDDAAWMAHSMLAAAQALSDIADGQINAEYLKVYAEKLRSCRAT
jgi:hypothetical protein